MPDLHKTKLCRAFLQGHCREGENCVYAHGDEDLRVTEGIYKTQMCNFYERGYCKKGDRCNHAHGKSDLRLPSKATEAVKLAPVATPGRVTKAARDLTDAQRSPLPLSELLVDSEGNTKSVTELASLAFSPLPASPPLWGYGAGLLSPGIGGEPTPPWPLDPLDVLLDHRRAQQQQQQQQPVAAVGSPLPLRQPSSLVLEQVTPLSPAPPSTWEGEQEPLWEASPPPQLPGRDPVVVDLSERLASLDQVCRELSADVQGYCSLTGSQQEQGGGGATYLI